MLRCKNAEDNIFYCTVPWTEWLFWLSLPEQEEALSSCISPWRASTEFLRLQSWLDRSAMPVLSVEGGPDGDSVEGGTILKDHIQYSIITTEYWDLRVIIIFFELRDLYSWNYMYAHFNVILSTCTGNITNMYPLRQLYVHEQVHLLIYTCQYLETLGIYLWKRFGLWKI